MTTALPSCNHRGDLITITAPNSGATRQAYECDQIHTRGRDLVAYVSANAWYYLVSGCLCGWDAYALEIGAEYQPPTQAFAVIDKEYGKVMALPMFVEAG